MKFKKNFKKGFTLVELIVVIAIVAILAAVSVVSYIAFINSANESADIQLVKQLNVALQADEALNGPRDTMHEMLGAMVDNGFVVENLTKTKSGYDIVWDQEHNRFGLLNGEALVYGESTYNSAKAWNIWKFADTFAEANEQKYSVYLTEEFAKTNEIELTVYAGVDVGNYSGLENISYINSISNQSVVIRTNGGTLLINDIGKGVSHYGQLDALFVTKTAMSSYHEYGHVRFAKVDEGRLVAENGGSINVVYATGSIEKIDVSKEDGGYIGSAYATNDDIANYAPGSTTEPKQIGNVVLVKASDEVITALTGENVTNEALAEQLNNGAPEENDSAIYSLVNKASFAGSGTEQDPYLIKSVDDLYLFAEKVNMGDELFITAYFKLINNVDLTGKVWNPIGAVSSSNDNNSTEQNKVNSFLGTFDGNNKTISNLSSEGFNPDNVYVSISNHTVGSLYGLFGPVCNQTGEEQTLAIKNLTLTVDIDISDSEGIGGLIGCAFTVLKVNNVNQTANASMSIIVDGVTVKGSVKSNAKVGGLVGQCAYGSNSPYAQNITITNCTNEANVTASSASGTPRVGGIVGNIAFNPGRSEISYCTNKGIISANANTGTGVSSVGQIVGRHGHEEAEDNNTLMMPIILTGNTAQGSIVYTGTATSGANTLLNNSSIVGITNRSWLFEGYTFQISNNPSQNWDLQCNNEVWAKRTGQTNHLYKVTYNEVEYDVTEQVQEKVIEYLESHNNAFSEYRTSGSKKLYDIVVTINQGNLSINLPVTVYKEGYENLYMIAFSGKAGVISFSLSN